MKRIIPISSGKGGVGKTSLAINLGLCLARYGPTILLDLDTGTSSIRNVIDAPIGKDLYHFLKKNQALEDCVTHLPPKLDRDGAFANFGFVAAPSHMIDSIANLDPAYRDRLIDAINDLDAEYVILDLPAGLDPAVTDFLPHSNSGILVFTPNHPAATLAASDLVKAILFRRLREIFHKDSPIYQGFHPPLPPLLINRMIDCAEDTYEPELKNLDMFLLALNKIVPDHPVLVLLVNLISRFKVYYVLNRFNGVENSYQTAVKPFVENIHTNISARPGISNLGWVIDSERYHRANVDCVPFLVREHLAKSASPKHADLELDRRMEELYRMSGLSPGGNAKTQQGSTKPGIKKRREDSLMGQLDAMNALFEAKSEENEVGNFEYIVACIRYLLKNRPGAYFGDVRLRKPGEAPGHKVR